MDAALDAESLIGPRVSLRPFSLEDVPAVLAYASDPEVTRHLEWDAYDDPKTAMAFIRSTHAGTAWIARAIVLRTDERVIGGADLRVVSTRDRRAELGYGLARSHWGQGYATEAAGLLPASGSSVSGSCASRPSAPWRTTAPSRPSSVSACDARAAWRSTAGRKASRATTTSTR